MARDLTAFQQPMTTRGDVIAEDSTPKPVRLGLGTADQVFAVNHAATDPVWQTVSTLLDNLFSSSQGAVLYRGSSAWVALAPGTSGQFLKTMGAAANPLWADVTAAAGLPTGFIRGFMFSWVTASTVSITKGQCRDSADAANIQLTTGPTTVTLTTDAAINGNDKKTMSGTVATNSANATITGTSTVFTTDFGTRALSAGTIGTGGSASTTITGSSTKFMTDLAVNDLVGNASVGYSRVTAIASDTSCTVAVSLTITNGSSGNVIENATFQAGTQTVQRVNKITSDTSLTIANNSSATASGLAAYAGAVKAGTTTIPNWTYLWACSGGSGTGFYFSTQRTTPYGVTGYTTSVRRIGAIPSDNSNNLYECAQRTDGETRYVHYEHQMVLSAGTATAWTALTNDSTGLSAMCAVAPPSCRLIRLCVTSAPSVTTVVNVYVREKGFGAASLVRSAVCPGTSTQKGSVVLDCGCDLHQGIDYVNDSANGSAGVYCVGFWDQLA